MRPKAQFERLKPPKMMMAVKIYEEDYVSSVLWSNEASYQVSSCGRNELLFLCVTPVRA